MSKQTDLLNLTDAITVDSSNNVGIGTSLPLYNLDVYASNSVSMIRTPDTTSPTLGLFVNSGSNGVGTISVDNGGHMTFDTASTGVGQTERMRIDASGRVTMPYQPAFRADFAGFSTTSTYTSATSWTVQFNRGSHFNSSNGRFVAPVAGVYVFSGSFLKNNHGVVTRGRFYVNGGNSWSGEFRTTEAFAGYNETASLTQELILNVNDYVEWRIRSDQPASLYSNGYNYFSGHLIG